MHNRRLITWLSKCHVGMHEGKVVMQRCMVRRKTLSGGKGSSSLGGHDQMKNRCGFYSELEGVVEELGGKLDGWGGEAYHAHPPPQ